MFKQKAIRSRLFPGATSPEQVSQQVILARPVNNVKVVLLQLQTPAKELLVVVGHSLQKHKGIMVSVDRDYLFGTGVR